jgi:hypothetical protein
MSKIKNIVYTATLLVVIALVVVIWPASTTIQASQSYLSLSLGTNISFATDDRPSADPYATNMELTTDIVTYPPEIDTDKEKLAAIYSIIDQMRLEHNRQGKWAAENWKERQFNWNCYDRIFKKKMTLLFNEKNTIEDRILKERYSDEYWKELSPEAKEAAYLVMHGDRETLKETSTLATCTVLDQLKAIDITKLYGQIVDPYEDFTTWVETDSGPGGSCTVTTNTISIENQGVESEIKVTRDYGADHFTGDFEHYIDTQTTVQTTYDRAGIYYIGNSDAYYDSQSGIVVSWGSSGDVRMYLESSGAGGGSYTALSSSTRYYLAISRTSTTGALYVYSDSNRTSLVDSLSVSVASTAWRYIICGATYANGHYSNYDWDIYNLDIGETADLSLSSSSRSFGVLYHGQTYWSYNTTLGYSPSWPLSSGECYAYLQNTGTVSGVVTVNATDFLGGITHTLTDGSPGTTSVRMSLFKAGDGPTDNITLATGTGRTFTTMTSGNVTYFDVKLEWCTGYENDAVEKTSTIYFTISAS